LSPPFEALGERGVTLANLFEVIGGINRIGQYRHNVGDDEPPFIVVNSAADFLSLEKGDAGFGILAGIIHGLVSKNYHWIWSRISSSIAGNQSI
jgi:hypothetical protein